MNQLNHKEVQPQKLINTKSQFRPEIEGLRVVAALPRRGLSYLVQSCLRRRRCILRHLRFPDYDIDHLNDQPDW